MKNIPDRQYEFQLILHIVMTLLLIMLMAPLLKYCCFISLIELECYIFQFSLIVTFQYLKFEIYESCINKLQRSVDKMI